MIYLFKKSLVQKTKKKRRKDHFLNLCPEESEVQDKVEIPEEAEVPEVTEIPDLKGREDETQEETPLPVQEPTREPEVSSQPVTVSKKETPVSSVSRKDRDQRVQKKKNRILLLNESS